MPPWVRVGLIHGTEVVVMTINNMLGKLVSAVSSVRCFLVHVHIHTVQRQRARRVLRRASFIPGKQVPGIPKSRLLGHGHIVVMVFGQQVYICIRLHGMTWHGISPHLDTVRRLPAFKHLPSDGARDVSAVAGFTVLAVAARVLDVLDHLRTAANSDTLR